MQTSRRTFIKQSTTLAISTAFLGQALPTPAAEQKRWLVSCRDNHLKATGKPDCWSALKFLECKAVEVNVTQDLQCPSLFHPQKKYNLASPAEIELLQNDLRANGVTVTAFCMSNRLDEQLEREVEWMKKLVPAVQKLGTKAIRIDVVPRALKRDQFLPFAIKACQQLCQVVEPTPIHLGIENHGNTTNDPVFLEKLFDGVGSSRLGLTLDPANFYWYGHPLNDLYPIYEKFASRAFHTHCKTIKYPEDKRNTRRPVGWEYEKYTTPLYAGDIDYRRVAAILRKANYQGDLCLENECLHHFPKDQAGEVLKKEIAYLTSL